MNEVVQERTATLPARRIWVDSGAPPRPPLVHVVTSFAGGLLAIAAVGLSTQSLDQPLVLGSFGASQPRNLEPLDPSSPRARRLVSKVLEGISLWAAMLHSWIGMQVFPYFDLEGRLIAPHSGSLV